MEDKIKQKIEKQSFIIYPIDLKGTGLDWNKALRDEWVKGAEYGYNIKENVNEKIEQSIRAELYHLESISQFTISTDTVRAWIDLAKDDFSASNQENNEGWISVEDRLPEKVFTESSNRVLVWQKNRIDISSYNHLQGFWETHFEDKITHWKEINPPKEK